MERWRLQPARDLGLPLGERLRSLKRESGLIDRTARVAWWSAVRAYFAVAHRLSVTGREHLPSEPPFVLVANHASHLDAMLLAAALPGRLWNRVFPIAAGDTFFETPAAALFAGTALFAGLVIWATVGTSAGIFAAVGGAFVGALICFVLEELRQARSRTVDGE